MAMYTTKDGDMLDDICFRHYGTSISTTEQVLAANPGLGDAGPVFVSGINITLPSIQPAAAQSDVRLWD